MNWIPLYFAQGGGPSPAVGQVESALTSVKTVFSQVMPTFTANFWGVVGIFLAVWVAVQAVRLILRGFNAVVHDRGNVRDPEHEGEDDEESDS